MKKVLAVLGILLVLFIVSIWFFYFRGRKTVDDGPKPLPMTVGAHSEAFSQNIDSALAAYYNMVEGFVNWDTNTINKSAGELKTALENFRLGELQKDTSKDAQIIYLTSLDFLANAKNEAGNISQNPSLDKKRQGLNTLSENLRNLFLTVHYDKQKIYYQECPTAFDETSPGYWLSPKEDIRNPYYGTQHPKHQDKMVNDGNSKGVIIKETGNK